MFPLKKRKIGGYTFGQKTWYSSRHLGVDYSATKGTDLYAPFDGEVIKKWGVEGGNTIWFKYKKYLIRFMHLDKILKNGEVKMGQIIGKTGNSGLLTKSPHLHVDISKNYLQLGNFSNFVDPEKFKW